MKVIVWCFVLNDTRTVQQQVQQQKKPVWMLDRSERRWLWLRITINVTSSPATTRRSDEIDRVLLFNKKLLLPSTHIHILHTFKHKLSALKVVQASCVSGTDERRGLGTHDLDCELTLTQQVLPSKHFFLE
jgi:hypothetical protein